MSKYTKLLKKILSGRQDASIDFSDIVSMLRAFGFLERIRGSHHIFYRDDIAEILNIQPNGSKAKQYQVKQIREIIVKYKLEAAYE
jgi:predicted RNA binding protein YcfA (HicA-like mRNA interferase family)